ncbi:OLC1v1010651C1 [Oldenlandia corymbosa var. corymbosa]|uniref:OLC1v1010651C1 n=1 Tax=Oldenlandia corymbosa var. corymbosa TaxID=529605 RepID=A0AAV1DTI0_OLDCO|nr:OLC1v1010651C1 [Oldenlandia corymbosa var. corymbosa]
MGNSIITGVAGRRNRAKVMKISGETFKVKTPVFGTDVIKDYPGHVLLESEKVKRFGIRAKPLEPEEELKPKKIYFLVELPKLPEEKVPRRTRSAVNTSAKDRLECLMLSRKSGSDMSIGRRQDPAAGPTQVKLRLPRAQLEKLAKDSKDETELAERIVQLCSAQNL